MVLLHKQINKIVSKKSLIFITIRYADLKDSVRQLQ
jgi:hypothetical protein